MKKEYYMLLSVVLLVLGLALLFSSDISSAGAAIGPYGFPSDFNTVFALGLIFVSLILFVGAQALEHIVGHVEGINPVTRHMSRSPLYSKVTSENISEIFQTDLQAKYRRRIMGAKAVVYMDLDGRYHTAFLTEAIDTHHRHAAATVARLIDGVKLDDPSYLDKRADALYEGNSAAACDLLIRCAGFELQYDVKKRKIIGIQQDSWITKEQYRCNRRMTRRTEEDMILELLSSIDPKYLSEGLKNLDNKAFGALYAKKRAA